MTLAVDKALDQLIYCHGAASAHKDGTLLVTPQIVCKSEAGYYAGTWCIEVICKEWLPQPYSRDSIYFATEAEAQKIIDDWER